jgi:hypothetical protein
MHMFKRPAAYKFHKTVSSTQYFQVLEACNPYFICFIRVGAKTPLPFGYTLSI